MNERIREVRGRGVVLPWDDIDTDRIIPASFMKCVTFDGLGDHLFHDERFTPDGELKEHPLNDPRFAGASILVSGRNFGCGSSREHAPQSLKRAGFRGVVAGSFAEIFFGNALALGIPCVCLGDNALAELGRRVQEAPSATLRVELSDQVIGVDGEGARWQAPFQMPPAAREALLTGRWDPLAELLGAKEQVQAAMRGLAYLGW